MHFRTWFGTALPLVVIGFAVTFPADLPVVRLCGVTGSLAAPLGWAAGGSLPPTFRSPHPNTPGAAPVMSLRLHLKRF